MIPWRRISLTIREIEAKSILRAHKKIDSWFLSRYGMNLYRGCTHNCVYCDGRAERYNVDGEFGIDVSVKINAFEVLHRELDPKRKRILFKRGYIMVGGGVGDSYQPIEKKYELTRRTLSLLSEKNFPVHILTKSTLVKRDIDILEKINDTSKAIVSFSFSSTDEKISRVFEPGVPSPQKRLDTISFFKEKGIPCGIFLLPVIPFITDTNDVLTATVQDAQDVGVDFILFGGMTLKEGKQKAYFLNSLKRHYPKLISEYQNIYQKGKWGQATQKYYEQLLLKFHDIMKHYRIPTRIPPELFNNILNENDLVVVILEHLDYLLKLEGKKSSFGYAAYSLSQVQEPLSKMLDMLHTIKGVGKTTESIIWEILASGNSKFYEHLLRG